MNVRPFLDEDGVVVGVDVLVLNSEADAVASEEASLVAVMNPDVAMLELLQTVLEDEGYATIAVPPDAIESKPGRMPAIAALQAAYNARVLVYDLAPPYAGSFAALMRIAREVEQ